MLTYRKKGEEFNKFDIEKTFVKQEKLKEF